MPRKKKVVPSKQETQQESPMTVTSQEKQSAGFRWTESYTSLFLGISVVIVGILFFVVIARMQNTRQVTSTAISIIPTIQPSSITGEITGQPTAEPTETPTQSPTQQPTNTPAPKPTKIITPEITKQPPQQEQKIASGKQQTYTVVPGDDLWHIAEKFYKSGYNYIDIIKANKMENPGVIYAGTKLVIPQVSSSQTTVTLTPTQIPALLQEKESVISADQPIKTSTYTIQSGDDLWDIAVRAYNDGYKWTEIAQANNLTNPSLIHAGNSIKIPR